MSKIQVESGQSSSATHRMTQASTTLNRRYVRRPTNVAVEEAARSVHSHYNNSSTAAPSRLVNLRVHAADYEAARAAEAKRVAEEEAEAARILAETNQVTLYPNVVEFGMMPNSTDSSVNDQTMTTASTMSAQVAPVPANDAYSAPTIAPREADQLAAALHTPDPYANSTNFNPFTTAPSVYTQPNQTSGASAMPSPSAAPATPAQPVDMDALAMNIAADYAAASLGASVKEYGDNYSNYAMPVETPSLPTEPQTEAPAVATLDVSATTSVDAIATAASEAIASIRVATDPAQVSEQVASLKTFAENIKSNHDSPEMKELGDTIEKFVNIAMKSTKVQEENAAKANSTVKVALPAKANRAAAKVTKSSAKVMAASRKKAAATTHRNVAPRPMARANMVSRSATPMTRRTTARSSSPEELKNRAIEQALHSVATMDEEQNRQTKARANRTMPRRRFRARHFLVAFTCAAACVAGIIYFVGTNIPDISVRVAAMQTGIQAAYPSYVPRDYSLGNITSENGKITLNFNGPNGASFALIEEKSSWDSAALLRNYVEPNWQDEYTSTHEQGITIYISNASSDAAWVNGGVLYKITSNGTDLTKKQVRSIVTSL